MTNFPTQEGAPGTDKSSEKRDKGTWKFSLNTKKRRAMLDNIGRREGEEGGDDEKGGEREGEKEEQIRKKSVKEDWKDNSGERRSRGCTRQRSEQLPDPVAVPVRSLFFFFFFFFFFLLFFSFLFFFFFFFSLFFFFLFL